MSWVPRKTKVPSFFLLPPVFFPFNYATGQTIRIYYLILAAGDYMSNKPVEQNATNKLSVIITDG